MSKATVFMIMRFEEEFFDVFKSLKEKFSNDFEFSHAGEEGNQQNILQDIIQPIYESDIIIADLTGLNPNVLYELGLAHSFNKKTIVITKDSLSDLPFDLKQYRAKDYETHFSKFEELINYLEKNLYGAVNGDISYSNPVKDFLRSSKISNCNWFDEDRIDINNEDSEKGIFNIFDELETDMNTLIDENYKIIKAIQILGSSSSENIIEIKKLNNNLSNSTMTKEIEKVAKHMTNFSINLKGYNKIYLETWDKIKKNIFGLLENKHLISKKNKDGLVKNLKSLKEIQGYIHTLKDVICDIKDSLNKNLGIESTLNQVIKNIEIDLETSVMGMLQMSSSIESILSRSRGVVGEIDFTEGIEGEIE